ncbi:MAG: hypothetical protein ACYS26_06870 [Planctomycetota bacterium]
MIELGRPAVCFRGERCDLAPAPDGPHSLGGTVRADQVGLQPGARPLQRIAHLSPGLALVDALRAAGHVGEHGLELLYGLAYSGCRLAWRSAPGRYDLVELEPREAEPDWPYPGAPEALPQEAWAVAARRPWPTERVSEEFLDGDPLDAEEGLVLIPPLRPGGVALWDPEGEAEGVQILFRVHAGTGLVRAWNRCT